MHTVRSNLTSDSVVDMFVKNIWNISASFVHMVTVLDRDICRVSIRAPKLVFYTTVECVKVDSETKRFRRDCVASEESCEARGFEYLPRYVIIYL